MMMHQNNFLLKKRLVVLKHAKPFITKNGLDKNCLRKISKKHGLVSNEVDLSLRSTDSKPSEESLFLPNS